MVKNMASRTMIIRITTIIVVAIVAFCVGLFANGEDVSSGSSKTMPADVMYRNMLPSGNTISERREAAGHLAKSSDASSWVVWILTAGDPFLWGSIADETTSALDRGVIAKLIEELPDDVSPEVLFALTTQLSNTQEGVFSKESGILVFKRRSDHHTEPIQDIASAALRRCTGQDHGIDAHKWREAILQLSIAQDNHNGIRKR